MNEFFNKLSPYLFFSLSILTVFSTVFNHKEFRDIAIALSLLYIIIEFRKIPTIQKIIGLILICTASLISIINYTFFEDLYLGLQKTLPFIILFASVTWLQAPSYHSPSLLSVRNFVLNQPSGRRFFFLSIAAHFLGAAFNIASFSLLSPMIQNLSNRITKYRLVRAMAHGFGTGTCWSPFFVGTVIVLSTTPNLEWTDIAFEGFIIGLLVLFCGWALDRLFFRVKPSSNSDKTGSVPKVDKKAFFRSFGLLCTLFITVITVSEFLNWKISISLAVVAPVFSLFWLYAISKNSKEVNRLPHFISKIFSGFCSLRGEVFLFSAANFFGVSFSKLIQKSDFSVINSQTAISPHIYLTAMMISFLFISSLGLHPVIFVIVLTSIITPETTNIPDVIFALSLMSMWGQGTNISPLSATVIYLSKVTEESNFTVAWKWHGPFSIFTTAILILVFNILLCTF
jgi:hypothetical protein